MMDGKSLQETMSAAYDAVEADTTEEAPHIETEQVIPAETTEAKAERERDEVGRFAKKDEEKPREKLTLKPKGDKDAAPQQERQVQEAKDAKPADQNGARVAEKTGVAEKVQDVVPAPAHWKGAGKVDWNRLPANVRQAIVEDYKQVESAAPINGVLQPHMDVFNREFGGAPQGLGIVLNTWKYARENPVAFVKEFMQNRGIDPHTLFGGGQGQQPVQGNQEQQFDPALAPILQELQQVKATLQHVQQQPLLARDQQIHSEIESLRTDPAFPYFNDVQKHMGLLMQTDPALGQMANSGQGRAAMEKAYSDACWAHPQIRQHMIAEHEAKQSAARKQAIAGSRAAAVSVNGAPGVNGSQAPASKSVFDSLNRAWDSQSGGRA